MVKAAALVAHLTFARAANGRATSLWRAMSELVGVEGLEPPLPPCKGPAADLVTCGFARDPRSVGQCVAHERR